MSTRLCSQCATKYCDPRQTCFHFLCRFCRENIDCSFCDFSGSDGIYFGSTEESRQLVAAQVQGNSNLVDDYLRRKAPLDGTDGSGMTALHYAAIEGNFQTVKKLLQLGAPFLLPDAWGGNAYQCAQAIKHQGMLELMDHFRGRSSSQRE